MTNTRFTAEPGWVEIVATCAFDAPRHIVYKMYTNPELIGDWWGPSYLTTAVDKMDLQPGGVWRFVQHDADGHEYAFNGVYHEIVPDERLVYTFEFEGMPGHILLATVTFEEQPGGTTLLTDRSLFQTVEDRDGMLQAGMEAGTIETMDRLARLLTKV